MNKVTIVSLLGLLTVSINVYANKIESFDEEFSVCISPSTISCNSILNGISFKNGGYSELMVSFRTVSADDDAGTIRYKVEFDNQTDCDITIGSTLLKQGSSNVNTLDWGNIEIPARRSKTSSTHTFHFSKRESERFKSMKFIYNGLASCPE